MGSASKRSNIVGKGAQGGLGPGTYDSDHKSIGKGSQSFTIGGKRAEALKSEVPGPGSYE